MTILFKTKTHMKPYNRDKYWIDADIIPDVIIEADSIKTALDKWAEVVKADHCISVSKTALKTKQPMYRDISDTEAEQVGYVITAASDFFDDTTDNYTNQYIDLWTEVLVINYPKF